MLKILEFIFYPWKMYLMGRFIERLVSNSKKSKCEKMCMITHEKNGVLKKRITISVLYEGDGA